MKLLFTLDDYYKRIDELLDLKPKTVMISSYGIWAGILPDGRDTSEWKTSTKLGTREILERLRSEKITTKMLIGLGQYNSCKGKQVCFDCERKYILDLIRHINHADTFPEFSWRMSDEFHLKCCLFIYDDNEVIGIGDGRNFTNSSWMDVSFELTNMTAVELLKQVSVAWRAATPLTTSVIGDVLEKQGISEHAIESLKV